MLKIGQHLPKLCAIKYRVAFYETQCTGISVLELRSSVVISSDFIDRQSVVLCFGVFQLTSIGLAYISE